MPSLEETQDPSCWIMQRGSNNGVPFILYQNKAGQEWRIDGECNQCGECLVGSVGTEIEWVGPVGKADAFVDLRQGVKLDCPVLPSISDKFPACTLSGVYL